MKKLLIIVICCFPLILKGEILDNNEIMKTASAHLQTNRCSMVHKSDAYCIIQRDDTTGFVIISLYGKYKAQIIGYSNESVWDTDNMPPVLLNWLQQLEQHNDEQRRAASNTDKTYTLSPLQKQSVSPLLTCHWHQRSPYNDLAPIIPDGNVKTVAGCVAIAAAQIAYYWRKDNPEYTLKDTPVYPYGSAPVTMSISKGTANNWDIIQDSYTEDDSPESKYAVAQLCYVIGTTSYLNYASSTGGSINDASNALYGQYNLISTYTTKNKYTQEEWDGLIYNELINGRPILCAGNDGDGHAFVLDGYDLETDLYHFNFGWGGSGDGYYPIDDSEIAMGGYYKNQSLVYNIHPKNRNIETILSFKKSEEADLIDIFIDITNKSTLPINELRLYHVYEGNSLEATQSPIWSNKDGISNNGVERNIIASIDVQPHCTLYLTDENLYILGELNIDVESSVGKVTFDNESQRPMVFDIKGIKIKNQTSGLYIVNDGMKRKKIFIK